MSKKILILFILFISLFAITSCVRTKSIYYEVISSKKNTVIEYRVMKRNNYGTELKTVKLIDAGTWKEYVTLHNGNLVPKDKLDFELIVRGEGEGKIFVAFKRADIIDPDHNTITSYMYIMSNETTNNYVRLAAKMLDVKKLPIYDE